MMFSPTVVVLVCGPAGSFLERPNFFHSRRSATAGLTFSMCVTAFVFLVDLTLSALVIVAVGDGGFDAGLAVECGRGRGEFG